MQNVMFIGRMASGKTTAADHLVKNFGYEKIAFADPIKHLVELIQQNELTDVIVEKWLGMLGVQMTNWESLRKLHASMPGHKRSIDSIMRYLIDTTRGIPTEYPKPRKRLQYLGTTSREQLVDDIWIRILLEKVKNSDKSFVVEDVRFPNEHAALVTTKFTSFKLWIDREVQHSRLVKLYGRYDPAILKHPSETEVENITELDHFIDGTKSIDSMLRSIEECLKLDSILKSTFG